MFMADEGEMISQTAALISRAVLAALAALESEGMLGEDSPIKNAGWMIGVYMEIAHMFRDASLIEDMHESKAKTFKFSADNLDLYLGEIAHRLKLKIPEVQDATKGITMPKPDAKDPWGWTRSFADYKRTCVAPGYAFRGASRAAIGGDGLDISGWSSAERKEYSLKNKDPLPKEAQDNLKKGLVLVLGGL